MNWRRALDIRVVVAAILLAGLTWFAIEAATDRSREAGPGRFGEIDAFVLEQMDASRIPGVALAIVEDGQAVHARGFGTDGRGNEVTAQTPFWIGSNTKSFTALAVMQLVEAGRIELDAPAVRYLPEFRIASDEDTARITVRHLLNQTSGFSRSDGIRLVLDASDDSLAETVAGLRDVELNRPVGESYQYSNLNFVVLGRIVEVVSGESWTDYVQAHIFDALGMTNSFTYLEEARDAGLTANHRYAFGFPLETEGEYVPGLAPTGYLYSTAEDMARYLAMYLEGGTLDGTTLLSPAGVEEMLEPATNEASVSLNSTRFEFQYGRGWFVGPFGAAEDARWHQGALPYFTSWMVLLPETDQALVVMINAGSQFEFFGANQVLSRIPVGVVDLLRGEAPPGGVGMRSFFIVFVTVVLVALAVQVWSLIRVARRPLEAPKGLAMLTALAPLAWELVLAVFVLLAFPAVFGGSWQAAFESVPDLALVLLVVALLWLATGVVRVVRLAQGRLTGERRPGLTGVAGPERARG